MATINKVAKAAAEAEFKKLLIAGSFPTVQYEKTEDGEKFLMMEYCTYWARACKIQHDWLVSKHPDGIFTSNRKNRNAEFIDDCKTAAMAISAESVNKNLTDRFKGMFD